MRPLAAVFWGAASVAGTVGAIAGGAVTRVLSRDGATVKLGLYWDRWRGRYTARYGPDGRREYVCVGIVPFLRVEIWRNAASSPR